MIETLKLPDGKARISSFITGEAESKSYSCTLDMFIDGATVNTIDLKTMVDGELSYHISLHDHGDTKVTAYTFGRPFINIRQAVTERTYTRTRGYLEVKTTQHLNGVKIQTMTDLYIEKDEPKSGFTLASLERVKSDIESFTDELTTYYINPEMVTINEAAIHEIQRSFIMDELMDEATCKIDCALTYLGDTWDCLKKGDIFGECQNQAVSKYDNCLGNC